MYSAAENGTGGYGGVVWYAEVHGVTGMREQTAPYVLVWVAAWSHSTPTASGVNTRK